MIKIECAWCGTEVIKRRLAEGQLHAYCNRRCMAAWRASPKNPEYKKVTKPCDVCGVAVTKSPSDFNNQERVYCSKTCRSADWGERFSGENSPSWTGGKEQGVCNHCGKSFLYARQKSERHYCSMECRDAKARVQVPCAWCGTEKEMARWEQKQTGRHFCNDDCREEWRGQNNYSPRTRTGNPRGESNPQYQKITKPCDVCGAMVTRSPSGFQGERVHCSRVCRSADWKGRYSGEKNPNWGGGGPAYYGDNWKEQRQAAKKRDGYRCQRCKRYKGQEGIRLQVHHKKKFRSFGYIPGVNENYKEANDLSNLITLCESCHGIVEPRNQYIK